MQVIIMRDTIPINQKIYRRIDDEIEVLRKE